MDGPFHVQSSFGRASCHSGLSYTSYTTATFAPTVGPSNLVLKPRLCAVSQALSAKKDCRYRVYDGAVAAVTSIDSGISFEGVTLFESTGDLRHCNIPRKTALPVKPPGLADPPPHTISPGT